MIFQHLSIRNFRNFKELDIDLSNKNVIFGLNDIGKTNFLCAIRYLLDKNFRKNGLLDSDFHEKDISKTITITLKLDISDSENLDNRKIYKAIKGLRRSSTESLYIQLQSNYSKENLRGDIKLFWGDDVEHLEDVPSFQANFEIDNVFNVVYIDSSVQLENIFKRYTRDIFRDEAILDEKEREKIKRTIDSLNTNISKLSEIKKFEKRLLKEYKNYRKERNVKLAVRSEITLDNIHSKLTPYICFDEKTYPTSGDGRKKILAYTLLSMENKLIEERRINVFLIEELENHLHRSMQLSLSHQLFTDELYKYMFLTTHSSMLVSQMDNVNLIKLYRENGVIGRSYYYTVPSEYQNLKKKLNQNLTDAIYADYVLLVEGPSEKILFETILSEFCKDYEGLGGYILQVDGIAFRNYYEILMKLGIRVLIKTDNDLKLNEDKKECNYLGLNRCLSLLKQEKIENETNIDVESYKENLVKIKGELYDSRFHELCDKLKEDKIYISRVDLENDLYLIIKSKIDKLAIDNNSKQNSVKYLQSAKMINMIELCQLLSKRDLKKILDSDLFQCIKELINLCNL